MNPNILVASSICVPHVPGMVNEDQAFTPLCQEAEAKTVAECGVSQELLELATMLGIQEQLDPHGLFGVRTPLDDVKEGMEKLQGLNENVQNVLAALAYPGSSDNTPYENLVCRLQDISALIVVLTSCTSTPAFIAALLLYARTHYTGVMGEQCAKKFVNYVKLQLFPERPEWEDLHLQAEFVDMCGCDSYGLQQYIVDLDSHGGDDVSWLESVKKAFVSWKTGRTSPLGKNVGNIVNILITLGFVPDVLTDETKFAGYKLFSAQAWDVQNKPIEFIEMVFETSIYFVENAYHAFSTGDWTVFLYSDRKLAEMDKRYMYFVSTLPLLEANKIDKMLNSAEYGITDEHSFILQLEKLMTAYSDMMVVEKGPVRSVLQSKYIALSKVRSAVVAAQRESAVRMAPYAVLIYGGSSIAKTSMDVSIHKVLAHANGFPCGKDTVCTLNGNDKYQSEYCAHHIGVRLDDLCNGKIEHTEGNPVDPVIFMVNNAPRAALKADVESKGNVMFNPRIVTATTNKKDLMAPLLSNAPGAVLRRFKYIIDGELDPFYVDPETGGFDSRKATGALVPDYWIINLQRVKLIRRGHDECDMFKFVTVKEGMRFPEVMDFLERDSQEHFMLQRAFVNSVEKHLTMELCIHSRDPTDCKKCREQLETAEFMGKRGFGPDEYLKEDSDSNSDSDSCSDSVLDQHMGEDDYIKALELLDTPKVDTETFLHCLRNKEEDKSIAEVFDAWCEARELRTCKMRMADLTTNLVDVWREHKLKLMQVALGGATLTAAAYMLLKMYRTVRSTMEPLMDQGCAIQMPEPFEEKENQWVKPVVSPLPLSSASISANVPDLCALVKTNLAHLTVVVPATGRTSRCNILPIWKDEWLMPNHMVHDGEFWVHVSVGPEHTVGYRNFRELVDPTAVQHIAGTDFAVIRLNKGGANKNLLKFFLEDDFMLPRDMFAQTLYRTRDGDVQQNVVKLLEKRKFTSRSTQLEGISYNYVEPTFFGQCMMTLVSNTQQPAIIGLHICGRTGAHFGVAGVVSQKQLIEASNKLFTKYPLSSHSEGTMALERFGKEVKLGPVENKHHPVHFLLPDGDFDPQLIIYGEHKLGTARFKSNVRKSPISDAVEEIMHLKRLHGPPSSKCFNKHYQRDLQLIATPRGNIPPMVVMKCVDDFWGKIKEFLDTNPIAVGMVHPMPMEVVLAGADGITFIESLNLSTSMGFPLNCAKNRYMKRNLPPIPGISAPINLEDFPLEQAMELAEDALASGERVYFVHRANLKDEPVKWEKDKIRVFTGCEIVLVCLYRKYFLGLTRMMHRFPEVFETGVGMNASGPEWDASVKFITSFCGENLEQKKKLKGIAGDFKCFDKQVPPIITKAAFEIDYRVFEYCGYDERQMAIVRGIGTECCYPLYEFKGVMVQAFGSFPAGIPGTVDQNGLEDALYLRVPFFIINGVDTDKRFSDHVKLLTVGDDHIAGVSPDMPEYNMIAIRDCLGSFGITYTSADKTEVTKPYYSLEEVTFLKRGYRYDKDLGMFTAPLDIDSISKSLHNYMHAANAIKTPEQIACDALCGALREMFQHGKEEYLRFRELVPLVAEQAGVLHFLPELPTYEQEVERYFGVESVIQNCDEDEILDCHSEDTFDIVQDYLMHVSTAEFRERSERWVPRLQKLDTAAERIKPAIDHIKMHKRVVICLLLMIAVNFVGPIQVNPDGIFVHLFIKAWCLIDNCTFLPVADAAHFATANSIRSVTNGNWIDYSGNLAKPVPSRTYERSVFTEPAAPRQKITMTSSSGSTLKPKIRPATNTKCQDSTRSKSQPTLEGCFQGLTVRRDVPQFVTQPLSVVKETEVGNEELLDPHTEVNEHGACIVPASSRSVQQNLMFTDMNPAYESCLESRYDEVRQMVDNTDATLANFFSRPIRIERITWDLNTTLFTDLNPWTMYFSNPRVANRISNYSQIRAKLHVKFTINGNPFYYGRVMISYLPLPQVDQITVYRVGVEADFVEASQRPHVFLDPSNSQGAEMILPYVYHLNNCSVPSNQIYELGQLQIASLSDLKHANAATQGLEIQVWAWAEDVHLAIPTQDVPFDLEPQSSDEYGEGIVSKPASVVSRAAGRLTDIPWIGPYARASEIGARAVSDMAKLFGYCKPVNPTDRNFVQMGAGNMVNTTGTDQSTKLSLDLKQELSVDPMVTGLGSTDEMTIRSIATRESYFNTFTWSPNNPTDGLIYSQAVQPALWRKVTGADASSDEYHLTAMCFATLPFKYWRGDIKFRFMVASSGMHKGRLRFVYEPNTPSATTEFNVNYSTVVDIAESRDFTLTVGWGQTPALLNHTYPARDPNDQQFSFASTLGAPIYDTRNGVLSVYVMNALTVPNTSIDNSVKVHVFVSAGDNFEVFVPDSSTFNLASWFPTVTIGGRSGEVLDPQSADTMAEGTAELGKTEQSSELNVMAPSVSLSDKLTSVHIGEEIVSFRNLLKRYCYTRTHVLRRIAGTNQNNRFILQVNNFPHYPGYTTYGLHTTGTNDLYNYTGMTLMNWLTPAFVCRRGGIRWKAQMVGANYFVDNNLSVERIAEDGVGTTEFYGNVNLPIVISAPKTEPAVSEDIYAHWSTHPTTWQGGLIQQHRTNNIIEFELPYYSNNRYAPGKRMDQKTSEIEKGQDNNFHRYDAITMTSNNYMVPAIDTYVAGGDDFSLSFYTGPPIMYVRFVIPGPKT